MHTHSHAHTSTSTSQPNLFFWSILLFFLIFIYLLKCLAMLKCNFNVNTENVGMCYLCQHLWTLDGIWHALGYFPTSSIPGLCTVLVYISVLLTCLIFSEQLFMGLKVHPEIFSVNIEIDTQSSHTFHMLALFFLVLIADCIFLEELHALCLIYYTWA